MYVKLTHEVTMYSSIDGPEIFPAGTVMHCTPVSNTLVKTRWGYLYMGDFTVVPEDGHA